MRAYLPPVPNAVGLANPNQAPISTQPGLNEYLQIPGIVSKYSQQYIHGKLTPRQYAIFTRNLFNRLNQYNLSSLVEAKVEKLKAITEGNQRYRYSTVVEKTNEIYADFILQHLPSDSITIDEQVRQYINRLYANDSSGVANPLRTPANEIVRYLQKYSNEFVKLFRPFNASDARIYAYFFDHLAETILTSTVFQAQEQTEERAQEQANKKQMVRAIFVYVFNAVSLLNDDMASRIIQGVNYIEEPVVQAIAFYNENIFKIFLDIRAVISLKFNANKINLFDVKFLEVFVSRLATSVADNDFSLKYKELLKKGRVGKNTFVRRSLIVNVIFLLWAAGMGYLLYWSRTAETTLNNAVAHANQQINDTCISRGEWAPAAESGKESCDIYYDEPALNILKCCFSEENCNDAVNVLLNTLKDLCNLYDKYENINFGTYEKLSIGMLVTLGVVFFGATVSIIIIALSRGVIPKDSMGDYRDSIIQLFNKVEQFLNREGIDILPIRRFVNEPSEDVAFQIGEVIDPILKAGVERFVSDAAVPNAVSVDMRSSVNNEGETQPLLPLAPANRTMGYVLNQ